MRVEVFFFFLCGYPMVRAPLAKKTFLSALDFCPDIFVKNQLTLYVQIDLDSIISH